MNESKIYLLFSIGPVQEFIAAGRKTRDLFSGSLMLSYLSAKAIESIYKHANGSSYQVDLIFPSIKNLDKIDYYDSSIPNRFLYSISGCPFVNVNNVAQVSENEVRDEFDKIINYAKKQFTNINKDDTIWNSYWDEQKNNFLEVYWAAKESEEDYSQIYNQLENLMGKRKSLRNFNELKYGSNEMGQPGLKCSLIQNMSAVHPSTEKPNDFWREVLKKYPQLTGELNEKEPLSAIALAKRFFISYLIDSGKVNSGRDKYPSTTTIAVSSFNNALIDYNSNVKEELNIDTKNFVVAVRDLQEAKFGPSGKISITNMPLLMNKAGESLKDYLKIDGDFLIEDIVYKEFKSDQPEIKRKIDLVNKTAKKIVEEVKAKKSKSISKYYAIIYFDGDRMGERLCSEDVNTISENLRRFSTREKSADTTLKNVYQVIEEENMGKVVYSGGDDVLAFTSLDDCLTSAFRIRQSFTKYMGSSYTGSAGIAIAHHQTDLKQVLNAARKAEKFAKDILNRDSFAFALLKRSGLSILTGAKWFNDNGSNADVITGFAENIRAGTVSTSFIFDLIGEISGLSAFEKNDKNSDAVLIEVKRLLLRHSNKKEDKEVVKTYYDGSLKNLYFSLLKEYFRKNERLGKENPIKQLCSILEVAQFIGQGGER